VPPEAQLSLPSSLSSLPPPAGGNKPKMKGRKGKKAAPASASLGQKLFGSAKLNSLTSPTLAFGYHLAKKASDGWRVDRSPAGAVSFKPLLKSRERSEGRLKPLQKVGRRPPSACGPGRRPRLSLGVIRMSLRPAAAAPRASPEAFSQ